MERLIRKDKNGRERFTDIRVEDLGDGTADIVKSTGVSGLIKLHFLGPTSRLAMRRRVHVLKPCGTMSTSRVSKCCLCWPTNGRNARKYISDPLLRSTQTGWGSPPRFQGWCFSRTGKPVKGLDHLSDGLREGEFLDGEVLCTRHDV